MKKTICILLAILLFQINTYAANYDFDDNNTIIATAGETESMPQIKAKAFVLMEKNTGKILYANNENERLYPASVTKIMSMLLIVEAIENGKIKLSDTVICSDNAASKGGSQIWLEAGESMSVDDLLKAVCVYSANDACTLLGEYVSGSEEAFVVQMNKRAAELNMNNTHFDNCTGLDDTTDTHLTSALDVALMSRALLKHDIIKKYTTIWMDTLRGGDTQLVNTNKLVRFYKGITGLKTGTTEKAGCCVSASAKRDNMELIAVVMGSDNSSDRFDGAKALLDYGFAHFASYTPEIKDKLPDKIKVTKGREDYIDFTLPDMEALLINKSDIDKVKVSCELINEAIAPVKMGDKVGSVTVTVGEKTVATYDITAASSSLKLNFFTAIYKLLTSF